MVAYYRVSTKQQGQSGLGLEGQKSAVAEYISQHSAMLVGEYREVETGKSRTRPELLKAIAHAKRSKATLVVAKLDRLARNVAFTSALMETKVDFVACDNPHARPFTIHILAAVAELEAEQISHRTQTALAEAKRRGSKLGSSREGHWHGKEELRQAGLRKARISAAKANRAAFEGEYADLFTLIKELHLNGESLGAIAGKLNEQGQTTRRGKSWNKMQVSRVLQRA